MGACIAAAIACAHASAIYAGARTPRVYFSECDYCGRAPDHEQKAAQCKACGAALKEKEVTPR